MTRHRPLPGPALFLKSRHAAWLPALAVVTILLALATPQGLVDVPLRADTYTILNVVAVAAPAGLAGLFLRRPSSSVELPVQRLRWARACWWGVSYLALSSCAGVGLAVWYGWTGAAIGLRNAGILMALTTVLARILAAEWTWAPALTFAGVSIVYGTNSTDDLPHAWAVLQHRPDSPAATWCWVVLTACAWVLYTRRDLRRPGSHH